MQKRLFFFLAFALVSFGVQAQLYPVFTQYYFNELVINPAYAGAHVQTSTTATYRNQWINFPGAPKTFSLTSHSSFIKGKVGLGLMINVDQIGSYANKDVTLCYSYKIKFPHATLSLGLQAVLYFLNADYSALNLISGQGVDPSFAPFNRFKPNIGAGIYYHKKNFFVGFSAPFLINSKFSADTSLLKQLRNYFLRTGFIYDLSTNVKINPSILLRAQEGQPLSADFNNAFIFYDVFSAGVSYRTGDAFITFVGLKLMENLYFNYSFDMTGSRLSPYSSGTHEMMLNYRAKINSVHKNLNCPTYHTYRE
ncbi:MAG: type IX secretion system membrane protein PorP/SprF [Bacteroidetes bacterium]|nr:type IX secretion system membrane protein PorP/SprF [Bacteroidota bacterium]